MADKATAPEIEEPVIDWEARAQDAESRNRDLEESVSTLNGMVGQYQQWLADSQLSLATTNAKYMTAVQRLSAASGAQ